jgi:hypothetical protein
VSSEAGYVFADLQVTRWTSGYDPSGCAAGYTTVWYEGLTLGAAPVAGTSVTDGAIVRDVGGNVHDFVATGRWDYDVRFSSWQPLPATPGTRP